MKSHLLINLLVILLFSQSGFSCPQVVVDQNNSSRGEVKISGDDSQSVFADNISKLGIGAGVTARPSVTSIDSH